MPLSAILYPPVAPTTCLISRPMLLTRVLATWAKTLSLTIPHGTDGIMLALILLLSPSCLPIMQPLEMAGHISDPLAILPMARNARQGPHTECIASVCLP